MNTPTPITLTPEQRALQARAKLLVRKYARTPDKIYLAVDVGGGYWPSPIDPAEHCGAEQHLGLRKLACSRGRHHSGPHMEVESGYAWLHVRNPALDDLDREVSKWRDDLWELVEREFPPMPEPGNDAAFDAWMEETSDPPLWAMVITPPELYWEIFG